MNEPYYQDDKVTLYHGDCREIREWLAADVLATDKRMSTVEILEEFEWILPFTDPESAAARVGTSLATIKTYYKRTGRIVPKRLKPEPSHGLTILRGPR